MMWDLNEFPRVTLVRGNYHCRSPRQEDKVTLISEKPNYKVWFFLSSQKGSFFWNEHEYTLCNGFMICLPPYQRYRLDWRKGEINYYSFRFDISEGKTLSPLAKVHPWPEFLNSLCQRILKVVLHSNPPHSEVVLGNEYLRLLLMELYKGQMDKINDPTNGSFNQSKLIESALKIVHTPQAGQDITRWARELGYTPTYFSALFKRIMGTSPKIYASRYRFLRACELLTQTQMKIREIAQYLGFNTSYHFSNQFKKWCGISPTMYRKKEQEENRDCGLPKTNLPLK